MRGTVSRIMLSLGLLASILPATSLRADELADGFAKPADEYHAMTWWHWMEGNISREGITADLEAMKRVGIQGAIIFHVGQAPLYGPVKFASPEWYDLMRFATQEAARLHLKLGFHNCPGWSSSGGPWITPEESMQKIVSTKTTVNGPDAFNAVLPQPKANNSYYRDITVLAVPADGIPSVDRVLDLSAKMAATGQLRWDVPAGKWDILRIGHTTTGVGCHPAPQGGEGLECDKLDRAGIEAHYRAYPAKILANAGNLAGKTLTMVEIDSYEVGDQDWTAHMPEQFRKRRGYDLMPWLAAMAGETIGSEEQTRRFRRDMTQTVADLFADEYYSGMRDLLHKTPGMQFVVEPYTGPFETSAVGATGDMVMGEFWTNPPAWYSVTPVASVAHVNGKRIVAAESLTTVPTVGRWRQDPYSLKSAMDRAFTEGVNLAALHTTAHQPWMNAKPGMTMANWGTQFGRMQTWWEQSGPWFDYLARCQYLLQQGLFVADVLQLDQERRIEGYRADTCGLADLKRLQVKDGRLVLPDGMSYQVLELPDRQEMLPETASRLRELVMAGATVVGPRPVRSPSLNHYPDCDREVAALADEIWGDCDGQRVREHALGKGRVLWGPVTAEMLERMGTPADVKMDAPLLWIHRQTPEASIYFVSNQQGAAISPTLSFRIQGARPELWHADTGRVEPAPLWRAVGDRTEVTLTLEPSGSVFVIFRGSSRNIDPVTKLTLDGRPVGAGNRYPAGMVIQKAVYGVPGDATKFNDVTAIVRKAVDTGGEIVASNNLSGDPAPKVVKTLTISYSIKGAPGELAVPEQEVVQFPGPQGPELIAELHAKPEGSEMLESWKNGTFTLWRVSGRNQQVKVADVPEAIEHKGPWEVHFPAGLGAPAQVTLPALIPLNEQAEPGVRYFSGTATYTTKLAVPSELLSTNRALMLDLGEVKNLAEVRLNGRSLAILWKPPFRLDVTDAVHAGENDLEIRVTNLWPNRLIGDEQLPDDCKWGKMEGWVDGPAGRPLLEIPEWLQNNHPRPSTGRVTFTTYKFYEKDAKLLRSGLIGPVRLRCSVKIGLPGH